MRIETAPLPTPAAPLRLDRTEATALALVLALDILDSRVPRLARVPVNLAGAAGLVALARHAGCSLPEQGLDPRHRRDGLRLGVRAGIPIACATALLSLAPFSRHRVADRRIVALPVDRMLYEAFVRVPFATAAAEETIFRGALLALFTRRRSPAHAALVTSLIFGAWHAIPAYDRFRAHNPGPLKPASAAAAVAISVAATFGAGLAFTWLRRRSGSILAPIVVHALFNATGIVSSWAAARLLQRPGNTNDDDAA